mmetsp:Transcript_125749/g.402116  ORF Transcript_125749/g.402116 Transcript_125749/m.402116 type:complete len:358 (+) Transcript_125749:60-1133(+)
MPTSCRPMTSAYRPAEGGASSANADGVGAVGPASGAAVAQHMGQNDIFCTSGERSVAMSSSPLLESLRVKNLDSMYMLGTVDECCVRVLEECDDRKLELTAKNDGTEFNVDSYFNDAFFDDLGADKFHEYGYFIDNNSEAYDFRDRGYCVDDYLEENGALESVENIDGGYFVDDDFGYLDDGEGNLDVGGVNEKVNLTLHTVSSTTMAAHFEQLIVLVLMTCFVNTFGKTSENPAGPLAVAPFINAYFDVLNAEEFHEYCYVADNHSDVYEFGDHNFLVDVYFEGEKYCDDGCSTVDDLETVENSDDSYIVEDVFGYSDDDKGDLNVADVNEKAKLTLRMVSLSTSTEALQGVLRFP